MCGLPKSKDELPLGTARMQLLRLYCKCQPLCLQHRHCRDEVKSSTTCRLEEMEMLASSLTNIPVISVEAVPTFCANIMSL